MWVYYMLLLVPLVIQHVVVKEYSVIEVQKKNQRALFFFFVLMTLLVALRHASVGNDTSNYIHIFERFSKLSWEQCAKETQELGYVAFNKIVSTFTDEPQVFFAITAIITVAMLYPTYKRLCVDPSLTIVLYVTMSTFVMMFSGIRQMLAIGIGIVAYECTRNKKIIPFILCVAVAMTFHASAFMLAFMYPLYHVKITKKGLLAVIPVLAIVFVFSAQIFSILSLILEQFTKYDAEIEPTGAYTMLILFALFAVLAFLIPDESLLDEETIGLRNFLLLSVVLQMFAPLHTIAMRMNYYYIIFIPLVFPKIIAAKSKRWGEVAVAARHVMVVFFLLYFFYNAYMGDNNLHVFPYRFFWEDVG